MKKIMALAASLVLPALLCGQAFAATTPANTNLSHGALMHRRGTHLKGTNTVATENWSGYAATGNNGSFNSVSSTWVQPAVNCSALPNVNAYSSYWVGLDGFSNQTVEQIGTEADCISNQASYNAWYEMYPSNPYEISVKLAVAPGDQMAASVNYVPASTTTQIIRHRTRTVTTKASYVLTLSNQTTGQSFSINITPRKSYGRSSAEVIAEAPASSQGILPLADYGTASFGNSLANGQPLGSFASLQDIIMQNPYGMVSTPTGFDASNENFSVSWSAS